MLVATNGWSTKINLSGCQLQLLDTYLYLETFQNNVISWSDHVMFVLIRIANKFQIVWYKYRLAIWSNSRLSVLSGVMAIFRIHSSSTCWSPFNGGYLFCMVTQIWLPIVSVRCIMNGVTIYLQSQFILAKKSLWSLWHCFVPFMCCGDDYSLNYCVTDFVFRNHLTMWGNGYRKSTDMPAKMSTNY